MGTKKTNKLLIFNKYVLMFLLVYFCIGVGVSYSYYAYMYEEDEVIVGNVIAIDADLEVEMVAGTATNMVPMGNGALYKAINGTGSSNGACIDSQGNLSCQVYKITLTNNGSRLQNITGTVELYAKNTSSTFTNLKWQELSSATALKTGSTINGMEKTNLVTGLTMESKEQKIWYIAVWISETDTDQSQTDKGSFGGTVEFASASSNNVSNVITEEVLEPNATNDQNINFGTVSSSSNTNGIYVRNGTQDNPNPIYYYRGNVNNNLIFADFCWKIVRTTETGGLKLIYNGVPSDGKCNNTGEDSQIGTSKFNSGSSSPTYTGYMYGDPYNKSEKSLSSSYVYGKSVSYANGTYTLTDTTTQSSYSTTLNDYHYTCFSSTETTCTSVSYIYFVSSSTGYYITLSNGKKVEDALSDMLDYNTNSSTIKGSSTTSGTLDYWYYTNIEQKGYSNYIEDTVWCNDRSVYQLNGWDPDGGSLTSSLLFSAYNRARNTYQPNLTCSRPIDRFTVDASNGNGDLTYPVGLLTADEIMLAGGKSGTSNSSYYLNSGEYFWAGSPYDFYYSNAYEFYVYSTGSLGSVNVNGPRGVRPSVSLAPGFALASNSGTGTGDSPYVVE